MPRKTADIRRDIESLRERISEHEAKIADECLRSFPDEGKIRHWESEIRGWLSRIAKLEARLARRRRRGRR